jgi:lysine 6-dehydrogenase
LNSGGSGDFVKILILGAAGSMAIECTRDLIRTGDFEKVILADVNMESLQRLASELRESRVSTVKIDARQKNEIADVMKHCDYFINGMPSDFSGHVSEVAIQLGRSGTDITGLADMFEYHEEASQKGCLIIAGLGCTPGITNVLAKYGSDRLDVVEEITIYFAAWRPIALSPGLVDFTVWALHPDTKERCYFKDGEWIPVEPFSGEKRINFMYPIGEQKVYYLPHQETITIPRYIHCRKVATLGTYPPEDMDLFRSLWKYGFLRSEPPEGIGLSPLEFVRRHLKQASEAKEQALRHYALVVEVKGKKGLKRITHRMAASHPPMDQWGGLSVYAKFTGIPLSVGSQLLVRGKVKGRGVLAPEACIPAEEFIAELKKRGILFDFEVIKNSQEF